MNYRIFPAVTVILLSAHVTTVILTPNSTPYFLIAGAAVSVFAFILALPRPGQWGDYVRSGWPYALTCIAIAWGLNAIHVYCVAYTFSFLFLVWIDVAHARGLVKYDPNTIHFVVTRCSLYALVRVTIHVIRRYVANFPDAVEQLVPLALSTIETTGIFISMVRGTASSYSFSQAQFEVYATLKAVVFVAVPRIERAVHGG